jgi:hypothetical protein
MSRQTDLQQFKADQTRDHLGKDGKTYTIALRTFGKIKSKVYVFDSDGALVTGTDTVGDNSRFHWIIEYQSRIKHGTIATTSNPFV